MTGLRLCASLRLRPPPVRQVVLAGPHGSDEQRFLSLLIEDKTRHEMSYVDFLCAVHRKIQLKMS